MCTCIGLIHKYIQHIFQQFFWDDPDLLVLWDNPSRVNPRNSVYLAPADEKIVRWISVDPKVLGRALKNQIKITHTYQVYFSFHFSFFRIYLKVYALLHFFCPLTEMWLERHSARYGPLLDSRCQKASGLPSINLVHPVPDPRLANITLRTFFPAWWLEY